MFKEGKVQTLAIDTLTYLTEYLWQFINAFHPKYTRSGELDTRGMYGELSTRLTRLVGMNIMSFPGNLVCTSHEMLESDEALDKKIDKSTPIVANVLGGFRNKLEGMFSLVMYLMKIDKGGGVYEYWARTNKGNSRNAKSRLPLPATIQNISYSAIMESISATVKEEVEK